MKAKVAILQPFIPHYREEFFDRINKDIGIDVFCYEKQNKIIKENFKSAELIVKPVSSLSIGPFLLYNPFVFLRGHYSILVLMLHYGHITTWILLLTKPIHRKKIILWGHGISVKRFIKEERQPSFFMKVLISLSDIIWLYTNYEKRIWEKNAKVKSVALNNTISGIDKIICRPKKDKESLKLKYNIRQNIVLIYCARFNEPLRRADLLLKAVKELDREKFGFIIIGDGNLKPDFLSYQNVYDFKALYDDSIKSDLFQLADIYFQPAWVGLSITEALAYGKPIYTFKRTEIIRQCVEYSYIQDGYNGKIFTSFDEYLDSMKSINREEIEMMSEQAAEFAENNLSMNIMVKNAVKSLNNFIY